MVNWAVVVSRRIGHPYQNRTPPKRKKPRTSFTLLQIVELEKRIHRQKYLASAERSTLAKGLTMTDAQVKTWFQNRRTKWRYAHTHTHCHKPCYISVIVIVSVRPVSLSVIIIINVSLITSV